MKRRTVLRAAAALLAATAWTGPLAPVVAAEVAYPTRTVRIVVPVAAGGSADKLARTLAQKLTENWGQSVVVENVPGASGTIGISQVARAAADGHTLLLAGDNLALNAVQIKSLSYDALKDFRGVVKAVVNPQIIAVRPDLGVSNLQEYLDLLKARPGAISIGLPGSAGGLQHLAHEILNAQVGVKPNFIPYPGGGPATLDVLGGHIDGTIITLAAVTEYVRAGKLTPIAVTTAYRSKALPDVPTVAESGVPGFSVESWQGIVAPSGTPQAVIDKLNADLVAVLRQPEVSAQLENLGFTVAAGSAQDVDDTVRDSIPRYAKVIADAGIKLR